MDHSSWSLVIAREGGLAGTVLIAKTGVAATLVTKGSGVERGFDAA